MSSKQRRPLDDPPSAASSSEETQNSEEEEEEEQSQAKSKPLESEDEEESEEEEEEHEEADESEDAQEQSENQKAEILPDKKENPNPVPESSSDSGDSDSLKSPRASDFTVKPVAQSQSAKGQPETPLSKPSKRRPDSSTENGKLKKSKPSIDNEEARFSATAEKKFVISRLWSEQDEIAVLKGLIEFQSQTGKDPLATANQGEFLEFVKKSLHVDVSKTQLMDKVRRLKKKYKNNVDKSANGEDPVLHRPHEYKSFQLSKQIWGSTPDNDNHANNANNVDKSSAKSARKSKGNDKIVPSVHVDNSAVTKDSVKEDKIEPVRENVEDFAKLYPFLMNAFSSNNMCDAMPGLNIVNENFKLVGGSELKELDSEWKELNMVETEIALRKINLIQRQTKMVLDAMKSSKS